MNIKILVSAILALTFFSCATDPSKNVPERNIPRANILRLAELNTRQIQSLDKNKTVVLLPGGILEEHGPYLPSFTDGYWNEKFADTLAQVIAARKDWNVLLKRGLK